MMSCRGRRSCVGPLSLRECRDREGEIHGIHPENLPNGAFITLFLMFLVGWASLNIVLMKRWGSTFDPYPFIFLNLILSMVAAIQAPIIMMSQNRQSVVDRMAAANDYEVNLRAELGVRALIDRLDELQRINQEQLELLRRIPAGKEGEPPPVA